MRLWRDWDKTKEVQSVLEAIKGSFPLEEFRFSESGYFLGFNSDLWEMRFSNADWVIAELDRLYKEKRLKQRDWNALRSRVLNMAKKLERSYTIRVSDHVDRTIATETVIAQSEQLAYAIVREQHPGFDRYLEILHCP